MSLVGACLLAYLCVTTARGASLAYEGFDYASPLPLTTQNGGSGLFAPPLPWTADPGVVVQPVGLATALGLPSTGLSVGGGFNAARQLANPLNQTEYWVSFEIQAAPGNDQVYLGFDVIPSPTPMVAFGRILDRYFIRQGAAPGIQAGVASPAGVTDLLAARFKQVGGFTVVSLWVNKVLLLSVPVPTVPYSWANLHVQPGFLADEIRIGTTVGDVAAGALGTLEFSVAEQNLTLTWAQGTLEQAPSPNGPWAAVNATSPYTTPMTGPQMYYRVLLL